MYELDVLTTQLLVSAHHGGEHRAKGDHNILWSFTSRIFAKPEPGERIVIPEKQCRVQVSIEGQCKVIFDEVSFEAAENNTTVRAEDGVLVIEDAGIFSLKAQTVTENLLNLHTPQTKNGRERPAGDALASVIIRIRESDTVEGVLIEDLQPMPAWHLDLRNR